MNREDFTFYRHIDSDIDIKHNGDINSTMVYLDNAASTQTPDVVIEAMDEYYTEYRANIHRGVYSMSEKASTIYDNVRADIARMIGASNDDIILTSGSTMSSNMLVYMLESYIDWDKDATVITTYFEHNSIAVPLIELSKRKGTILQYVDHSHVKEEHKLIYNEALGRTEKVCVTNQDNSINDIWSNILNNSSVKIINMTMASNVTGEIFDIGTHVKVISDICKKSKIKRPYIICDATAILGHHRINVHNLDIDAIWASGHKMCGPTGVGMLYIKRDISRMLSPHIYGGGMVSKVTEQNALYRSDIMVFEAGTSNISGVIGWGRAIKYIDDIGIDSISEYIKGLHTYMTERLSALPYIKLYTSDSEYNVGIISFAMGKVHPHDIAHILSDNGLAVRSGHHCAPIYINSIDEIALSRASLYFYNNKSDIDKLVTAIDKAWHKLA